MLFMILCDGRSYQVEPVPEGAIPDFVIEEKYPDCVFVDDATSTVEANSKIERDRVRRESAWW